MTTGADLASVSGRRKLVKAWRLFEAGFLYGAAALVRKERHRAMVERADEVLRAIERLTEEMRSSLSGERLTQFDEWLAAEPYIAPRDRPHEAETYRQALVLFLAIGVLVPALLVVAALLLPHGLAVALSVGGVIVFSLVPMYVANRAGEARGRRDQWIWPAPVCRSSRYESRAVSFRVVCSG